MLSTCRCAPESPLGEVHLCALICSSFICSSKSSMSCLQWECDRLPQTVIEYNGIVISVLMIYEWFVLTLQCNNLLLNGLQVFLHHTIARLSKYFFLSLRGGEWAPEIPGSSFFDSDSGSETVQSRNSVPIPRLSMARRRFRVRF